MNYLDLLAVGISAKDHNIPTISAGGIVEGLLTTVYWAAGIAAVVAIMIGGLMYTLSDGNAQKITRSKDIILYGVVGLAIVLVAFIITNFVVGWFA